MIFILQLIYFQHFLTLYIFKRFLHLYKKRTIEKIPIFDKQNFNFLHMQKTLMLLQTTKCQESLNVIVLDMIVIVVKKLAAGWCVAVSIGSSPCLSAICPQSIYQLSTIHLLSVRSQSAILFLLYLNILSSASQSSCQVVKVCQIYTNR